MSRQIVLNRAKCLQCETIVISHHAHDFQSCRCGMLSVDGGRSYLKRLGNFEKHVDMSVYSDAPYTEIRKALHRGSRGPSGKDPLKWIPICEIDDAYLENLIEFMEEMGYSDTFDGKMYLKEKEWRGLKNNV